MVQLGPNRYGKAEVRVVHIGRGTGPDGTDLVRDWNVSTSLAGDLAAVHLSGDNSHALPTPRSSCLPIVKPPITACPPVSRWRFATARFPSSSLMAGVTWTPTSRI